MTMLGSIPSSRCQTTCVRLGRSANDGRKSSISRTSVPAGGARRDRTDDLLLAKQALSQLSYGPWRRTEDRGRTTDMIRLLSSDVRRLIWWAWIDSNDRPHPYQGCALTT